MSKDIGFLFIVAVIIYDALMGRVQLRYGHVRREGHPIVFWIMTSVSIFLAALLLWLALYDFRRRLFP